MGHSLQDDCHHLFFSYVGGVADSETELTDFLADAVSRQPGNEVSLTIRDFIALWGAKRRGYWYVQQIQEDLDANGLRSDPPFEEGWIDNHIRLVRADPLSAEAGGEAVGAAAVSEDQQTTSYTAGTALKVSNIESATGSLVSLTPSDSLIKAQSMMLRHDYSQLPVLSGARDVRGAISWESIAQKIMHQADAVLADCVVPVDVVGLEDDLLPHVPRIIRAGYVLVRSRDRSISGIVTTSDLSGQFLGLAEPFLLVGEAERKLRGIVAEQFELHEIQSARDARDGTRTVNGVDDLTLGELVRLFQSSGRWERLNWGVDRGVFNEVLRDLVGLRNEVMHFSADPIEAGRLEAVRNLLKWLNFLLN